MFPPRTLSHKALQPLRRGLTDFVKFVPRFPVTLHAGVSISHENLGERFDRLVGHR